ncbi:MAG: SIS domain-containing protein [Kiritimatiellaeota bacterium]|nr:SIS domain-containing protein [Kiritimatiellota bacterium]
MNYADYLDYADKALRSVKSQEVQGAIDLLWRVYRDGRTVFVIGNGGSAATASHLAQDLAKGTRRTLAQKKRVRALALTDSVPFLTAYGNDDGYEFVFEQQLRNHARRGDVLIAISGSGNSPNILCSVKWAKQNGLTTLGITGFDGGKLRRMVQHKLHVPLNDMCTAESVHSVLLHYIVLALVERIHGRAVWH